MNSQLAFVVGAERSGTTWLWRTLSGHPEVLGIPETHLFAYPTGPDAGTIEQFRNTPFWRSVQGPGDVLKQVCEAWIENLPVAAMERFSDEYLASFDSWQDVALELFRTVDGIRPWIIEKTPGHVFFMDRILQKIPAARFIGIVRDGRDVLSSLRALDFEWTRKHQRVEDGAQRWAMSCTKLLQAQKRWPEQVHVVRYEDLLEDTGATLRSILDFLDCSLPEEQLEKLVRDNTFESYTRRNRGEDRRGEFFRRGTAGGFRDDLTPAEIATYEHLTGPILERFGYPLLGQPSGEVIGRFLDRFPGTDDNQREYFRVHRKRYIQTLELLPRARPGQRLLELGSAFHHMTPYLAQELGYQVFAHDRLEGASQITRRIPARDGETTTEVQVNSFDVELDVFPYEDASLDCVVCCEVLEHLVVDPMHMLGEINRVLKPGGRLLLTTPNAVCAHSVHEVLKAASPHVYGMYEVDGEPSDRHNREYTPQEVARILDCAGFQVQTLKTAASWWDTDPKVLAFLRQCNFPTDLRDDNTLVVAERVAAPRERYPAEFYLSEGTQGQWRSADAPAASVALQEAAQESGLELLVIHERVPQFDSSGSDLRLLQVLRCLRDQGHRVTFLGCNRVGAERYGSHLEALGIRVIAGDPEALRWYTDDPGPGLDFGALLERGSFDAAILCTWFWTGLSVPERYLPKVRLHSPATRVVLLSDDVHWFREDRLAQVSGHRLDLERSRGLRVRESFLYEQADLVLSITEDDARRMLQETPGLPVSVVHHAQPVAGEPPLDFDSRAGLLFVGAGDNEANRRAVKWLVEEIFPRVRARLGDVTLTVVGQPPAGGWPVRTSSGVDFVGHVPDLTACLHGSRVFVSPIQYGTGIKTKNLLALAHGVPLVTTPIGAEGMQLAGSAAAVVRTGQEQIAEAVIDLYTQSELWQETAQAGLQHVQRHFSLDILGRDLELAVQRVRDLDVTPAPVPSVPALQIEESFPDILAGPAADRQIRRCQAHVRRAVELRRQGDVDAALQELRNVLIELRQPADWPPFAGVFAGLAELYLEQGDRDEATASLEEALRLDPTNKDAHAVRGALRRPGVVLQGDELSSSCR